MSDEELCIKFKIIHNTVKSIQSLLRSKFKIKRKLIIFKRKANIYNMHK